MSAEVHAKIAAKVYPDREAFIKKDATPRRHPLWRPDVCSVEGDTFNLLETDSNGNPTMQAKASALDVLVWIIRHLFKKEGRLFLSVTVFQLLITHIIYKNPCAAIYEAAREIVDES